jgi:hypothetical protein
MADRLPHLEKLFPALASSGYSKSSEYDPGYNCIAFAVHDKGQWWQKVAVRGYYWPIDRDDRLEDWIKALGLNGYSVTDNWDLEKGIEKVAIYVNQDGSPEHVSRQLESGTWTSKMGKHEDIEHPRLAALKGKEYGEAMVVMKRRRFKKK